MGGMLAGELWSQCIIAHLALERVQAGLGWLARWLGWVAL